MLGFDLNACADHKSTSDYLSLESMNLKLSPNLGKFVYDYIAMFSS